MTSSLIRGKYVIAKITGPSSADVVTDGAVLQQDGLIAEVGDYQQLRTRCHLCLPRSPETTELR